MNEELDGIKPAGRALAAKGVSKEFQDWCDLRGVDPNEELQAAFWGGFRHARNKQARPELKLPSFTNTVMTVYQERDQARSEVQELAKHLALAGRVNARFQDLLESARVLILETDGV
jgi:hypothetical protein